MPPPLAVQPCWPQASRVCQRHSLLGSRWPARASRARRLQAASDPGSPKFDILALSNLCLDVVVPVDHLPDSSSDVRRQLLEELHARTFDPSAWELGGAMNGMVAGARLGLRVGAIGHVGDDEYGAFVHRELQAERIEPIVSILPASVARPAAMNRTLVCFVLVDPQGRHAFCSAYDFGPWPLLDGVTQLPPAVQQALASTHSVIANGFVFDDLPLELVQQAAHVASDSGAAICFDPGPRCFTMRSGSRRVALDTMLDLSDIVLMTMEEAKEVTGQSDAGAAARCILERPGAKTQWCVVKQGADGALLLARDGAAAYHAPAIPVEVSDTVGCGDSFAAAILLGYVGAHDIMPTLVLANAVGAATAMGRGAGRNVATAARVQSLLEGAVGAGRHDPGHVKAALGILAASLGARSGGGGGGQGAPGHAPPANGTAAHHVPGSSNGRSSTPCDQGSSRPAAPAKRR